jgi:hypothetical protein
MVNNDIEIKPDKSGITENPEVFVDAETDQVYRKRGGQREQRNGGFYPSYLYIYREIG